MTERPFLLALALSVLLHMVVVVPGLDRLDLPRPEPRLPERVEMRLFRPAVPRPLPAFTPRPIAKPVPPPPPPPPPILRPPAPASQPPALVPARDYPLSKPRKRTQPPRPSPSPLASATVSPSPSLSRTPLVSAPASPSPSPSRTPLVSATASSSPSPSASPAPPVAVASPIPQGNRRARRILSPAPAIPAGKTIRIRFEIPASGKPEPKLLDGTGDKAVDQRILEVLRTWTWEPAFMDGENVDSVEVFRLSGGEGAAQ